MTDYTATGPEASKAAFMRLLQPGDKVTVTGVLTPAWSGVAFPPPGVLMLAAPGATLAGYPILRDVQGVTLEGFKVIADKLADAAMVGLGGGTTERVILRNTEFIGMGAVSGGRGAGVLSSGITISGAKVHDLAGGFSCQGGSNITVEDVEFYDILMDCMGVSGGSNLTFRNWHVHDLPGSGLHHDVIQSLRGIPGLTIHKVRYERGQVQGSVAVQFLFLMGGGSDYIDLDVQDCAAYGCAWEGLHITNARQGLVKNNFVQGDGVESDGQVQTPWLKLSNPGVDLVVQDNQCGSLIGVAETPENTGNVTIANSGDPSDYLAFLASLEAPPDPDDTENAILRLEVARLTAELDKANQKIADSLDVLTAP